MKHARPDYDRFQDPAGLIPTDEPVFLLRGQDRLAHMAVRHYGVLARDFGLDDIARASFQHADLMMEWAKKLPDMPVDADFREIDEPSSAPALPIMNGDHAEFEREWDGKDPKTRPDWPYPSFDAQDWAEAFCKIANDQGFTDLEGRPVDEGWMISWFANALMRGTDEMRARVDQGIDDTEHFAGRMQHWFDEAQRLAKLVRSLGGDPMPGVKQPATPERTRRVADLNTMVELLDLACGDVAYGDEEGLDDLRARLERAYNRLSQNLQSLEGLRDRIMCDPDADHDQSDLGQYPGPLIEIARNRLAGVEERWNSAEKEGPDKGEVSFLIRLAKAYLSTPTNADLAPAQQELAEICKVLGCITKPGVALQFVERERRRVSEVWARNTELLRSWDEANLTERQELDCLRRGWGPSTPTERMYRRENVASCLRAIEAAMGELTVSEEESASVPSEAQIYLDAAHAGLARHQETIINLLQGITTDPQEWPDIKAAEERGAMRALGDWTPDECQKVAAQLEDAAGRTAEQALVTTDMGTGLALIRKARNYRMIARLMRETGMPAATMSGEEEQITKPPYRPGDCITRRSDGGCFTVALVDGCRVITFGEKLQVPPTLADVELQKAATDEQHKLALLQLKRSGGLIAEKALRLYGDPEAQL